MLLVVPTLLILSMIVFLLVRFIPGDVIDAMQEEYAFTAGEIDREALERKLGLDQPIPVQYARWLGDIVLHGSLGQSLLGRFSVNEKIAGRLPVTIQLGVTALVIGLLIALPVGSTRRSARIPPPTTWDARLPSSAWQRPTSGWR